MKEQNLLASVALFGELFNNETYTNVFEIIAEFIKEVVVRENKLIVNSQEIKILLEKTYGFQIPESVIRTTLNNKFKDSVIKTGGNYHFNPKIKQGFESIEKDYQEIISVQNQIIKQLYSFIEKTEGNELTENDRNEVFNNFQHFLLGNGIYDKYNDQINTFIIKNEFQPNFRETLNSIKEGVIIYQGIIFTADLNELGAWKNDLTIFLNTEHLFNALGYNGVVFQEVFNDFHKLVVEANMASRNRGEEERIKLRYFDETKNEIDRYFNAAESIKRGTQLSPLLRTAMKKILSETTSPSDVKALRVRFDAELKLRGIILQDFAVSIASIPNYNVYDEGIIEILKQEAQNKSREFDENSCSVYFDIFTKINYYRKGKSNEGFEKIGYILMTDNGFIKYLASNNLVKFKERDVPFAKDIDYITTKLWFKLKKGFSNTHELPKAFDVVTKAKIALSSKLNNSISIQYDILLKDLKDGKLSKEEALERTYMFRQSSFSPEEINAENVDETFDFLNDEEYYENIERERIAKEKQLQELQNKNLVIQAELDRRNEEDLKRKEESEEDEYINIEYTKVKYENSRCFRYLFLILVINFILILSGLCISLSKTVKGWFGEFGILQILIISIYALVILIETFGSKYVFNKDKIKKGWEWLKIIISKVRKKEFEEKYRTNLSDQFKLERKIRNKN